MKFSWDNNKSAKNKVKHGIDFEQAKEVFEDDNAIVKTGKTVKEERRLMTIGKILKLFIITVVFTVRKTTIRIISARQSRDDEIKQYLTNALKNQVDGEDDENGRSA